MAPGFGSHGDLWVKMFKSDYIVNLPSLIGGGHEGEHYAAPFSVAVRIVDQTIPLPGSDRGGIQGLSPFA